MDHSWGRNVSDLGLANTGSTLCARFLGHPNIVLTNGDGLAGDTCQQWFIVPNAESPFVLQSLPKFGRHFPYIYGDLVERDVPV